MKVAVVVVVVPEESRALKRIVVKKVVVDVVVYIASEFIVQKSESAFSWARLTCCGAVLITVVYGQMLFF